MTLITAIRSSVRWRGQQARTQTLSAGFTLETNFHNKFPIQVTLLFVCLQAYESYLCFVVCIVASRLRDMVPAMGLGRLQAIISWGV